jgi:spore coat polysaccharide biosynthesis protein SpsF (cytidylyltransferase family)
VIKTVAILQARMGSERFPYKMMAPIFGEPLIKVMLDIVDLLDVDHRILAIPSEDEVLSLWGLESGFSVIDCPNESNVISRFIKAGYTYDADIIIRVCGNGTFNVKEANRLIKTALLDYPSDKIEAWRFNYKGYPMAHYHAPQVEPFTFKALKKLDDKYIDDETTMEHVTPHFWDTEEFVTSTIDYQGEVPATCIDTLDDWHSLRSLGRSTSGTPVSSFSRYFSEPVKK